MTRIAIPTSSIPPKPTLPLPDQTRLIASLKQLSTGENLEEVVDIDEVLRYFVAHNFVVSFDSYTRHHDP